MKYKHTIRLTGLILAVLLTLFVTGTAGASIPLLPHQSPVIQWFVARATLSNEFLTEGSPVNYTIDFDGPFQTISEVDYYFIFGDDPLDQWESLVFTGDFPGAFGFTNINATPQYGRWLTSPCSVHPEVCNAFLDGSSQGEITLNPYGGSGSATLNISSMNIYVYGTRSITVQTDIKPGSDTNPINTKSRGTTPVAILSTTDFDATTVVDQTSLTFGATGDEASLAFCNNYAQDVNGDGLPDLVCHFYTQQTGFQLGDAKGILKGQTVAGTVLEGSDVITYITGKVKFNVCPFDPIMITLSSPDPVWVPVQITSSGQDLNFGADDPPGVNWAVTDLNGTVLLEGGQDDHFHFTWAPYNFSDPGSYYVVFNHPEAGSTYPTIRINLACDVDAPEP